MRKFWGFYDNGTYRVGCSGATIYLYDQSDRELCKFRDIPYAYTGAFQPHTNRFAAKSTDGSLAFYDLDGRALLKKIVITRIGAQDEGFAFSPDGKVFYNIEKPSISTRSQLTLYDTASLTALRTLFAGEERVFLQYLEFGADGICYVLGFIRNESGVLDYGFIAQLADDALTGFKPLPDERYYYLWSYKTWQLSGFTEKKLEWSPIKLYAERPQISLEEAYRQL